MRRYRGRKVVILGLARQGTALARYLAGKGARVTVSDLKPAEQLPASLAALADLPIEYALGGHPASLLDGADWLCLSGGIPNDLPIVNEARRRGVALSNDSQVFLEATPATVIGITGSAGKTTTTTLVGKMALTPYPAPRPPSMTGKGERGFGRVWVGGNIGNPLIAEVDAMQPGDLAVMELSSFQLEIMTLGPHVAAVLNLTPNHLDRHGTMAAYTQAKSQILRRQSADGLAVLGRDDPGARGLAPLARGRVLWFSREAEVPEGAFVREGEVHLRLAGREQTVCPVDEIRLRGGHNLLNVLAACAISGAAGVAPEAMRAAIRDFAGVEHRLEFVREWRGARWYNDSIATAPERSVAALRSFAEPIVLLAGGRDKQLPWDEFAREVRRRVKHLVLFGEAAPLIEAHVKADRSAGGEYPQTITVCGKMAEAVSAAARLAEEGDVVLLAPGGTSFDEFADFAERGRLFREWVLEL